MAGIISPEDEKPLQFWQDHAFASDNEFLYGKMADSTRALLVQLQFAKRTNRISESAASLLTTDYFLKYSAIVDDPKGPNTFSDGALSLSSHRKCESKSWTSSLASRPMSELLLLLPSPPLASQPPQPTEEQLSYLSNLGQNQPTKKLWPSADENSNATSNSEPLDHHHIISGHQAESSLHSQPQNDTKMHNPCNSTVVPQNAPNKCHMTVIGGDKPRPGSNFSTLYRDHSQPCRATNPSYIETAERHFNNSGQSGSYTSNSANLERQSWRQDCSPKDCPKQSRFGGPHKRKQPEEDNEEPYPTAKPQLTFKSARQQLTIDQRKKACGKSDSRYSEQSDTRRFLGPKKGPNTRFVSPIMHANEEHSVTGMARLPNYPNASGSPCQGSEIQDERLKNVDPKMIEIMMNEIMDHGFSVSWDDIAGLEFAKKTIMEIIIWPMLRPDLFTGLRGPPKGILLFGPPGTGKTLIGKCIASQSKATFFCISASSLTSKWVGDGEKMVRALFSVARCHQPAVIFIDEVDSLLTQRSDSEHESSRRIKTEFLVQLDGVSTGTEERLLIVGATNRPQELDEAARRRFVKRLYIPLPEASARRQIVSKLLLDQKHSLCDAEMAVICTQTEGYSGADMANLCKEASLGPIRNLDFADIESIMPDQIRPIALQDFHTALRQVRASVSEKDLELYADWNQKYGSGSI